ncbi:MAG: ABC transporter ATP-binding protein [Gammaproteobacteria bacterium]|nr:ABC transporter ATP-binding protein [Gammaproteobacteria bacterium]
MQSAVSSTFPELETKSLLEVLSLLPRTLAFVYRASPFHFCISTAAGTIQAGLSALLLWLGKVVIDRVARGLETEVDWFYILLPMVAIVACRILQSGASSSSQFVDFMVSEKVRNKIHVLILKKAASLDLAFFEAPAFYDLLSQARRNMGYMRTAIRNVLGLLPQTFMIVTMFGLLTILHPLTFLFLLVSLSPRILLEGFTARERFNIDSVLTRNTRVTNYFASLLFSKSSVKEVRVFNLGNYLVNKFFEFREVLIKANFKLNVKLVRVELLFDLLGTVGLCLVWSYAVYKASIGELSIGELYMVFGAAQSSKNSIQAWFGQIGNVFRNSLYITRFFELIDLDPRTVAGALETDPRGPRVALPTRFGQGIELKNVAFHYPGTDRLILEDISFSIPANTKLAIVGENGAGKTTLVKLLARFYDPIHGSVCLDGRDYRDYDLKELRQSITVIFQDFARFHISLADNIGLGSIDFLSDSVRIQEAAQKGGAHELATGLPNQYDTILGRRFGEGVDLSGGEWQNVALSRAFMSDAQLFILDEPTAALDSFKEAEVFDRFSDLTEGRTVLLVSHRFSTVRIADLICVIENGRVIEYGTHEELIRLNGKYCQMFVAQAERYR